MDAASRLTHAAGVAAPPGWPRHRRAARVGFFLLLAFVAPQHLKLGTGIFGLGLGITAYTLGLRHAFDADHIGAIDNTTRKLMSEGQRPLSVGFFFSLGHSTVVFALAIAARARHPRARAAPSATTARRCTRRPA